MKIYNSMTGKKEEFKPIKDGEVKMYACGITVYDLSHIGHARQAIVYSMIKNYLEYRGYKVTYVRNYTDVDDKIINKANTLGKNAIEFSREQIEETEKDMATLHVAPADIQTKASEYIDKIIDNVDDMLNGVRIELEEGKEDPIDFALWKSAKPGEISWDSPWGKGRPGWHIECSAMALNTLGETIHIHGGGRDLLFPHHENEIAQSEALTGKTFANYWSHCGLIKINGEKMSKSLGNSLTIRDALKMYDYEVIKYLMFSKHYGSDMDILDSDFLMSEKHMYYFYMSIKQMEDFINTYGGNVNGETLPDDISEKIIPDFIEVMDDDFNTAAALANLHGIFKYANGIIKSAKKNTREQTANTLAKILKNIKEVYGILGLFTEKPEDFISKMKEKYLSKLNIDVSFVEGEISKRAEAKKSKDFETADAIRSSLDEKGIILNDTAEGTVWDIKALY